MSHRTHPLLCRQLPVVIALGLLLHALALIGSPVTAQEDVTAVITRAAERMAKVQSFHFTVTTPRGKTQITEQIELAGVEGDIQRPDRFRASFTAKAAVVTLTVKVVGIGNKIWVTNPMASEETYIEVDGAEIVALPVTDLLNPDRLITAAVNLIENPEIAGEDKINDAQTTHVKGTLDPRRIEELAGTPVPELTDIEPLDVSLWIDGEGLVVRAELTGRLTPSETGIIVRRLDLSNFDEPITIEPPENVETAGP